MKMNASKAVIKAGGGLAGMVVLLAILVAANVTIGNVRLRKDLTEDRLYTLSDGSRNVVRKLKKKVTLKFFFNFSSAEVPVYLKNYARQVEDLLREYQMVGGRKVAIEKYDPKPDSDAEEWAQKYGISRQSVAMFGPPVYFGLAAVMGDAEGVIPVLDPRTQELLEYNVTRLIYRVTHPEKPVVGVMSSLPVLGRQAPGFALPGQPRPQPVPPWLAFEELRDDYEMRELSTDVDSIDSGVGALVLVHPKELKDKTLFAIDQFLLRGGKLLAFLDPFSIADMQYGPQDPYGLKQTPSNIEKLLNAWGVGYDPGKVVMDRRSVTRVRGANNQIEESPVLLSLNRGSISRNDTLTARLENILLPYTGSFTDKTTGDLKFVPLLSSSETSALVDSMSARFGEQALRNQFKGTGMAQVSAVRVSGKFKTAFPEGKPEEKEENADKKTDSDKDKDKDKEPKADSLKEGTSTVILVADTDMLADQFCVEAMNFFGSRVHRPLNDNLNFFANAVEQITGSEDLIGIRSRGKFNRPFDRVLALEQKAREEWKSREDDLTKKLEEAQGEINKLQSEKDASQKFILSPQQRQAIDRFRQEEIRIKKELKQVRKNLRRDIDRLGVEVKLINIALMPLLVALAGVGYGVYRRRHG